jgi:hypothetical protein
LIPIRTTVALSATRADGEQAWGYIMKTRFLSVRTVVTAAGVTAALSLAPLAAANAAFTLDRRLRLRHGSW